METAYMKSFMDPEWLALNGQFEAISDSIHVEVYLVPS
jgi:hypothetical protein